MRNPVAIDTISSVRLLIYNIRYATGVGPAFHLPVPGAGYLRSNPAVLRKITEFIKQHHLEENFSFSDYLRKCIRNTCIHLASIHWQVWLFALLFVFVSTLR